MIFRWDIQYFIRNGANYFFELKSFLADLFGGFDIMTIILKLSDKYRQTTAYKNLEEKDGQTRVRRSVSA